MSESFADYYDDMNEKVFEDWFENVLLPKLTKERNIVIIMANAKYRRRLKRHHQ